jgi:hypothetical protein
MVGRRDSLRELLSSLTEQPSIVLTYEHAPRPALQRGHAIAGITNMEDDMQMDRRSFIRLHM